MINTKRWKLHRHFSARQKKNENYISNKKVKNPGKDWIKFENHHEELVYKVVFAKVQEMLKVQRRRTNKMIYTIKLLSY